MILVDAGPLVALVDGDDQHHENCVAALRKLREPMGTVWPAVTEAMYLLVDLPTAQEAVWDMLDRGAVELLHLDLADISRIRELMQKYADRPMDLADAALVRVAGINPAAPGRFNCGPPCPRARSPRSGAGTPAKTAT